MRALDHEILTTLGRLMFATANQLAYWCDTTPLAIYKRLPVLVAENLIAGEEHARPAIWRLTFAGGRRVNKPMPAGRRHASWSVMAHACHRNASEISLRESRRGFRFLDRLTLLKSGLNPAFGEHAGNDESDLSTFVLVDDYMMGSDRIARSWQRRHKPNPKYWPDPAGRVWRELAQDYLVVCTDEHHAERHRDWLASQSIPAEVLTIDPLWRST